MTYFCSTPSRSWNVYWKASDQENVNVFDEDNMTTKKIKVSQLHIHIKENFL